MEKTFVMLKVSIVGQGYVGLTISLFAGDTYEVTGFDSNDKVVTQLNQAISHIEGVPSSGLASLIEKHRYRATSSGADIADSDIVIIAVPTPLSPERKPDLSFIEAACKTIGQNLSKPALIINESTSYPGTLRNFIKPTIEKYSPSKLDHQYAISPERVDPGRTDFNQRNTPRLMAGLTPEATEATREFYAKFCDRLIEVSSPEVAECAKLFENTFRQVNIALVNEFAQITYALGIDVYETIEAAATKPYGFMKFSPSAGVGGHCIPVDPTYLASIAEELGAPASFIRRANEVNLQMPSYIVDRVEADNGGSLSGKSVLIVGVAYKPNVADTRETPAELVIGELRKRGATVHWHDEIVGEWRNEKSVSLSNAQISIVLTKHDAVDVKSILESSPYVFDTTGKVTGAKSL
jgi:UDP-N-acetyl-D-glucosamine dehydrogenase